ncbi:MAG: pseudaminic acid synthase [Desulfobulbus sp.]|jgi:pseudaminic acid synthase
MKPTYIIAEMSANHCGDIQIAKKIIRTAKECGADAVKMQTYTADTLTIDCRDEIFKIQGGLWHGRYLYDLYKEASTPWEWHAELKNFAENKVGIELFSTPFDTSSVDFLEEIGVGRYKIASFEAIDIPFVEYVAARGKPLIISTGICTKQDIDNIISACKKMGNQDITLLKCTSSYPAPPEEMNLMTIPDMAARFRVQVGLSDHSMYQETAVAAVALGAKVIEKHFTLDRKAGGVDAGFSLNPEEFKATVDAIRVTEKLLGTVDYSMSEQRRRGGRSLFIVHDIKKGERFSQKNVRSIRPGYGCSPNLLPEIINKTAAYDLKKGTPMEMRFVADGLQP